MNADQAPATPYTPPTETISRPSRIRYLIVGLATLMAFLLYLDRFCVSILADYIRQEANVTQTDIANSFTAFFLAYALAQVPSGYLSDRFGARGVLALYILGWSLFTALTGAVSGIVLLLAMRFLCGAAQAGAYPTAAAVVGRWVPVTGRGLASAFVANGGRIGGALAPVLTAYLIVLLVPLDTPVLLQPEDILNPQEIVVGLTIAPDEASSSPTDASKAAKAGRSRQIEFFRQKIDGLTVSRLDDMQSRYRGKNGATAAADPANADLPVIADALNQLLKAGRLYDPASMEQIKLPQEGSDFLTREIESEEDSTVALSEQERLRLHRLILESAFNTGIRKLYGQGWRPIMYFYGLLGIPVAVLFWVFFRDRPELHPNCNEAEQALIHEGRPAPATGGNIGAAPVMDLITSGNMWCCCLMQWGTNIGWLFIMTWLPRYLLEVHQVPLIERGYMTMTPALVGMLGMFIGGSMTDVIAARVGVKWGRRIPIAASRVTAMLAYVGCIGVSLLPAEHPLNSPWVFTALLSVVAFSTDFGAAPTWAFSQDIGGRHIGSVLGWGNMWGNLGAAAAPAIYNYVLGESPTLTQWNQMFGVCAFAFLLSLGCALIIDASKPLLPEEGSSSP